MLVGKGYQGKNPREVGILKISIGSMLLYAKHFGVEFLEKVYGLKFFEWKIY